jgi:hypothetical protein
MPYQLVLREPEEGSSKAVGENTFLANLPANFPVYAFYYPAEMPDSDFEKLLRTLGERTGENLFVNIGRLNDPQFDKIVHKFEITSFPTLVMTAVAELAAAPNDELMSAYVRLDGRVIAKPDRAIKLVEELYLLFLQKDIARAIKKASRKSKTELARTISRHILAVLGKVGTYLTEHDFSVSILQGRFEVKKSG